MGYMCCRATWCINCSSLCILACDFWIWNVRQTVRELQAGAEGSFATVPVGRASSTLFVVHTLLYRWYIVFTVYSSRRYSILFCFQVNHFRSILCVCVCCGDDFDPRVWSCTRRRLRFWTFSVLNSGDYVTLPTFLLLLSHLFIRYMAQFGC